MIRQSQATILLTRPQAQSARFAEALGVPTVISPLMAPRFLTPDLPEGQFAAVILTSETGVAAARRISAIGRPLPRSAFCVGPRTARAAAEAGFDVLKQAATADDLAAELSAAPPMGRVLILRPEDSIADLQNRLESAGIETFSAITYRQEPCPLTQEAVQILQASVRVILPIFSPRSALLFAAEYRRINACAAIDCVAISEKAAAALGLMVETMVIAQEPNGASMRKAVLDLSNHRKGS